LNATSLFEHWRHVKGPNQSWGLAWFLANEFCQRFYSSHGIAPHVIEHEGLGYYGIELNQIGCKIGRANEKALGRLTMGGDVENWRRGSPGDHGLPAIEMCSNGISTENIVSDAIRYMEIDPVPAQSHLGCRHQRWGGSYSLAFEISTILALRHDNPDLQIWNHPSMTKNSLDEIDPHSSMKEHPGGFIVRHHEKEVVLTGDGRLLDGSERNLWNDYMKGESANSLAELLWDVIL
jgi:hypothetical protein